MRANMGGWRRFAVVELEHRFWGSYLVETHVTEFRPYTVHPATVLASFNPEGILPEDW